MKLSELAFFIDTSWHCFFLEYMAGILASHGYTMVDDPNVADLWLLNSCTVKNPSEQTFVNEIQRGQASGKRIVLAGCVPQAQPKNQVWDNLSIVGVCSDQKF
jgi:threonylcarbamoyladenosine tRNA methylthiotransferase CDKAL1